MLETISTAVNNFLNTISGQYDSSQKTFQLMRQAIREGVEDVAEITCTEFARPSDTTAYTANDIVNNSVTPGSQTLIEIPNIARVAGGSFLITGMVLFTDLKTITPDLRITLYNASNPTIPVDNAASATYYANASKMIGYIDLDTMISGADTANSTSSVAQKQGNLITGKCAAEQTSIWALIQTKSAFTPASGQKFTLKVTARRG